MLWFIPASLVIKYSFVQIQSDKASFLGYKHLVLLRQVADSDKGWVLTKLFLNKSNASHLNYSFTNIFTVVMIVKL